tara:strand:- start:5587 stop:6609 length:1023 start_codon:yes stop_codon:yes gene_type:complete
VSFIKDHQRYKKVFHELVNGYSEIFCEDEQAFVKHISEHDLGALELYGEKHYEDAKKKGLPSEEEQLNILIKGDLWSYEQEEKIESLKSNLATLHETHKKLFLKRQLKESQKKIDSVTLELSSILQEKEELVGLTCEKFSERKSNEEIVFHCFYKDRELTEKFFTRDSFEELHHVKLYDYIKQYNSVSVRFSYEEMKKLAAFPFFTNLFFTAEADIFKFYGKNILDLTACQIEVFNISKMYKAIMEQGTSPPEELYEDISRVVSFFDSYSGNGSKALKEAGNKDSQSIVGASIKEMQEMTKGTEGNETVLTLDKALENATKGKKDISELSMIEIAKMHGY